MRFTLESNCLIDVEEDRPSGSHVKGLVALHGHSGISVSISAIGASERQRSGGYAKSFSEYKKKLKLVGLDKLRLLLPIAYADICYVDYCRLADEGDTLEQDLHKVLFPGIEFKWADYAAKNGLKLDALHKKWRNATSSPCGAM